MHLTQVSPIFFLPRVAPLFPSNIYKPWTFIKNAAPWFLFTKCPNVIFCLFLLCHLDKCCEIDVGGGGGGGRGGGGQGRERERERDAWIEEPSSHQVRNWRAPPPVFHTLAKDMSLNRGATHSTLGLSNVLSLPYFKYTYVPLSKIPSCAPGSH